MSPENMGGNFSNNLNSWTFIELLSLECNWNCQLGDIHRELFVYVN